MTHMRMSKRGRIRAFRGWDGRPDGQPEDYSGVYERICASYRRSSEFPVERGRITTLEEWNRGKEQES